MLIHFELLTHAGRSHVAVYHALVSRSSRENDMRKVCDASGLHCPHSGRQTQMIIAVNFGGKLRSYCCNECANDDIQECSDGRDNLQLAVFGFDVFRLTSAQTEQNFLNPIVTPEQESDHCDALADEQENFESDY